MIAVHATSLRLGGRRLVSRPDLPMAAAMPLLAPGVAAPVMLAPTGEARLLRRLRHVVRRRIRVDVAGLVAASMTDGDLGLSIRTVSPRDPHVVEWTADRLVALVVLHDGCGARVIGSGGLMGRIELPSIACAGAFLAFCYDGDVAVAPA